MFLCESALRLASPDEAVQIGLMCCAPKKENKIDPGMNVVYKNLTVTRKIKRDAVINPFYFVTAIFLLH